MARGLLALAGTGLTALPVCNLVFQCGCTWFFSGGTGHCNMHQPSPPHCPPCTNLLAGTAFAAALFSAWAGALAVLAQLTGRRSRPGI